MATTAMRVAAADDPPARPAPAGAGSSLANRAMAQGTLDPLVQALTRAVIRQGPVAPAVPDPGRMD